jgi:hypothetical protein
VKTYNAKVCAPEQEIGHGIPREWRCAGVMSGSPPCRRRKVNVTSWSAQMYIRFPPEDCRRRENEYSARMIDGVNVHILQIEEDWKELAREWDYE